LSITDKERANVHVRWRIGPELFVAERLETKNALAIQ
jgi:hypothetical protein